MKNVTILFAAAALAVGGTALVGCERSDENASTPTQSNTRSAENAPSDQMTNEAQPAGSRSTGTETTPGTAGTAGTTGTTGAGTSGQTTTPGSTGAGGLTTPGTTGTSGGGATGTSAGPTTRPAAGTSR